MSALATTRNILRSRFGVQLARPMATVGFVRSKHTLPDLPYDFGALEPHISGQIMETHYTKHHQTYVNGLNDAEAKLADAKGNPQASINLLPLLNFHGGGHVNHSLFWENLSPESKDGGKPPSGELSTEINSTWGSLDKFKSQMNTALAGVQGSGWGWLVKNKETGQLELITKPNQDPVVGKYIPLLGIDAWEHAYYLQYKNVKADYFKAIWNVINWKTVEQRFSSA